MTDVNIQSQLELVDTQILEARKQRHVILVNQTKDKIQELEAYMLTHPDFGTLQLERQLVLIQMIAHSVEHASELDSAPVIILRSGMSKFNALLKSQAESVGSPLDSYDTLRDTLSTFGNTGRMFNDKHVNLLAEYLALLSNSNALFSYDDIEFAEIYGLDLPEDTPKLFELFDGDIRFSGYSEDDEDDEEESSGKRFVKVRMSLRVRDEDDDEDAEDDDHSDEDEDYDDDEFEDDEEEFDYQDWLATSKRFSNFYISFLVPDETDSAICDLKLMLHHVALNEDTVTNIVQTQDGYKLLD
jgi:hypothetical protein